MKVHIILKKVFFYAYPLMGTEGKVTIESQEDEIEGSVGDFLVQTPGQRLLIFAQIDFLEKYEKVPGTRYSYKCRNPVFAKQYEFEFEYEGLEGAAGDYLVQEDENVLIIDGEEFEARYELFDVATLEPGFQYEYDFELTKLNSTLCHKLTPYFCTHITGSVNLLFTQAILDENDEQIETSVKATPGQWVVYKSNEVIILDDIDFQKEYKLLNNSNHLCREKNEYYAIQVEDESFYAINKQMKIKGNPGDYLIQDFEGNQTICSESDFSLHYEVISSQPASIRASDDLFHTNTTEARASANLKSKPRRPSQIFLAPPSLDPTFIPPPPSSNLNIKTNQPFDTESIPPPPPPPLPEEKEQEHKDSTSVLLSTKPKLKNILKNTENENKDEESYLDASWMTRSSQALEEEKNDNISSNEPEVRWEGNLKKKGERGMSTRWKVRWFRIDGGYLEYRSTPNSDRLGEISLCGANIEITTSSTESIININTPNRTYYLSSESNEQAHIVDILNKSIYIANRESFFVACRRGDISLLNKVLDNVDNTTIMKLLTEINEEGQSPIHLSAAGGDQAIIKALFDKETDPNIRNDHGDTALHIAARCGHERCIPLLINNNANINAANDASETPLHLSAHGTAATIQLLLSAGADIDIVDMNGNTPLMEMARHGNANGVLHLINGGAKVDHQSWKDGSTALSLACAGAHDDCVAILLGKGADVSKCDHDKNTPLITCISAYVDVSHSRKRNLLHHQKYFRCIQSLLDNNAKVDAQNRDGRTALSILCRIEPEFINDELASSPAFQALFNANADVETRSHKGYQPIHYAAVCGNWQLCRMLIDNNADVNGKASDGLTALDYVSMKLEAKGQSLHNYPILFRTQEVLIECGGKRRGHDISQEDDSSDLISMRSPSGSFQMKAATIDAMLTRLTHKSYFNREDIQSFFLLYTKIIEPIDLASKLYRLFQAASNSRRTSSVHSQQVNPQIRIDTDSTRVLLIFLNEWFTQRLSDFENDINLIEKVKELLLLILEQNLITQVQLEHSLDIISLKNFMKNYLSEDDIKKYQEVILQRNKPTFRNIHLMGNDDNHLYDEIIQLINNTIHESTQKNKAAKLLGESKLEKRSSLLKYQPIELAQQLTLLLHTLFSRVPISEFMSSRKADIAPRFHELKTINTRVSYFLMSQILMEEDINLRAQVMIHLITTAEICLRMNNLDSLMTLVAIFGSSAVFRLKKTWQKVNKKIPSKWESLQKVTGPAGRNLEKILSEVSPPCIPPVGLILKNLINLNEEPTNMPENEELINFHKFRKIGNVIRSIRQSQQTPYFLDLQRELLLLLMSQPKYSSEEVCWQRSVEIEEKSK